MSVMGPYGYQASPAELYFAAFKSSDINPHKIAATKSNFDALVQLVLAACQKIPRQQLILHHQHCLLATYQYLWYTPI